MPYLMNPTDLAVAIGAQCGGSPVSPDNVALRTILGMLLPRVEDLMEVASLTYGETTDTFDYYDASTDLTVMSCNRLRLSNGYVENSDEHPITILDPDGVAVTDFFVNERDGVITLNGWKKGKYTVTYYAGLKTAAHAGDWADGDPEFFDAPAWIVGIVVELLVMFYRTSRLAITPVKETNYEEAINSLDKEIKRRVYQRYQRPRDVEFPVRSIRTDGITT